jgi:hypothetical protein
MEAIFVGKIPLAPFAKGGNDLPSFPKGDRRGLKSRIRLKKVDITPRTIKKTLPFEVGFNTLHN